MQGIETEVKMIMFSPRKASIYFVQSREEGASYDKYLATYYYVVESDGTITAFASKAVFEFL